MFGTTASLTGTVTQPEARRSLGAFVAEDDRIDNIVNKLRVDPRQTPLD